MSEQSPSADTIDLREHQTPAKYALFGVVAVIFTVIDQVTKIWIQRNLERHDEIKVIDGFFSLVHAENPGAAFGMLGGAEYRMVFFGVFTVIALVVLGRMLYELPRDDRFQNVALGLVTSGAVGNAIDRVLKQSVTDFLRFYTDDPELAATLEGIVGMSEYPSFNVADIAIVVGLGMFVIHWLFLEDNGGAPASPPAAPADSD